MPRRIARNALLTLAAVSLSACSLVQKTVTVQPAVSGELLYEQQPVESVQVSLARQAEDEACTQVRAQVSSNAAGHFVIPAEYRKQWRLPLPGVEHQQAWRLCFTAGDEFRSWPIPASPRPEVPDRVSVRCELSNTGLQVCEELSRTYDSSVTASK